MVAARSGGRYAIRAVASVWPYMTNRSQPGDAPAAARPHAPRVDAPTGLGHGAQVREVQLGEPDPLEEAEGVRHPAGGHPGRGQVPEARVRDGEVGEDDGRAGDQVAVDDAQAVAVVQGQARHRTVRGADRRGSPRSLGVAREVVPGEADQPGDPVEPLVLMSSARSGCSGCRGCVAAHLDPPSGSMTTSGSQAAARVSAAGPGGGEEHRMPGGVGGEVADEGAEAAGALHLDEPALAREQGRRVGDEVGQVAPG